MIKKILDDSFNQIEFEENEKSPQIKTVKFIGSILLMAMVLFACRDECKTYSNFSCAEIENARYNVHFIYPDKKEILLGEVESLSNCKMTAMSFAKDINMSEKSWDYNCCMIAKGSECFERHH